MQTVVRNDLLIGFALTLPDISLVSFELEPIFALMWNHLFVEDKVLATF